MIVGAVVVVGAAECAQAIETEQPIPARVAAAARLEPSALRSVALAVVRFGAAVGVVTEFAKVGVAPWCKAEREEEETSRQRGRRCGHEKYR